MANVIVEQGKLGRKYKVLAEFEDTKQGYFLANRAYDRTELKPGEQKRMRIGKRKIKHLPCYWT